MNNKIFNAIWIVAIVVFLASLTFIMGVSYNYFSGVQLKQLRTEAELASQGVSMSGMDYLNGLEAKDYRITWIDADGTVLFDNAVNANEMENHLEREEIKEALADGYGESYPTSSCIRPSGCQMVLYLGFRVFKWQSGHCFWDLHSRSAL